MAAPISSFLQKLTPEIRIAVYGHVFGTSQVIKPDSSDIALGLYKKRCNCVPGTHLPQPEKVQLHTSILATSRTIFLEAIPVLYVNHTIRGTTTDFYKLLRNADFSEHVRRIEIGDCIGLYRSVHFHSVLRRLQILPHARSLVILSDCLVVHATGGPEHTTVPAFAQMAQLGEVTCTDVGRYQLHGMFGRFQFVNRRITQMWCQVDTAPDNYNAYDDLVSVMSKWQLQCNPYNRVAWATQTSLRLWVGLHDILLRTSISGELEKLRLSQIPSEKEVFCELERYAKTTRPYCYNATQLVSGGADISNLQRRFLRGLKAGDDQYTLLWATEYLAINITTYNMRTSRGRGRVADSCWGEIDGFLPTIEHHSKLQSSALRGLNNSHYFRHPWRHTQVIDHETASTLIASMGDLLSGILTPDQQSDPSNFSDIELGQLLCLRFALESSFLGQHLYPADWDEYEKWASDLLKRYLCAEGSLRYHELLHVAISELDRVVRVVLSVLASQEERIRCDIADHICTKPPSGFDSELFYPFAGQYGSLLERGWREYMVTPGASAMDLG